MVSRTNFKQQLMREQSELLEKKEKGYLAVSSESSSAVSVPYYTPQVIPSNILTYESKLDHPTCYHIKESKNRKVQEFLSQGHRPENTRSLPLKFNVVNTSQSPTDFTEILTKSTASPVEPEEFWYDFKTSTAFSESVADSGVEPSFSPTSETDMLDMFTTLTNVVSASAPGPAGANSEEPVVTHNLDVFKKERQKKNNHNRIEKNRRCVINDHIKELSNLLPKQQEPLYEIVKDSRQSKGTILRSSVDYMKALKEETKKIPKLEKACYSNEQLIRKLQLKIQEYEILFTSKGIPIPNRIWYPSTKSDLTAIVKQEPHFGSGHETRAIASIMENSSGQVVSSIAATSDQNFRPRKPIMQFLTVQQNIAPETKLSEETDSASFQKCNYPPMQASSVLEELMDDDLISDDVFLSSRSDSCTPEDMDYIVP